MHPLVLAIVVISIVVLILNISSLVQGQIGNLDGTGVMTILFGKLGVPGGYTADIAVSAVGAAAALVILGYIDSSQWVTMPRARLE